MYIHASPHLHISTYPQTHIHVYTYVCVHSIHFPSRCLPGYAVALDMTARDLQQSAKEAGLPWTISKGYDTFTAVGETVRVGRDGVSHLTYLMSLRKEIRVSHPDFGAQNTQHSLCTHSKVDSKGDFCTNFRDLNQCFWMIIA